MVNRVYVGVHSVVLSNGPDHNFRERYSSHRATHASWPSQAFALFCKKLELALSCDYTLGGITGRNHVENYVLPEWLRRSCTMPLAH